MDAYDISHIEKGQLFFLFMFRISRLFQSHDLLCQRNYCSEKIFLNKEKYKTI